MAAAAAPMTALNAVGAGTGSLGLANVSRSCSIRFNAVMRSSMSSRTFRSRLSAGNREPTIWSAPLMPASGFLTSCATIADICPSWARVSRWRRRASAAFLSVTS